MRAHMLAVVVALGILGWSAGSIADYLTSDAKPAPVVQEVVKHEHKHDAAPTAEQLIPVMPSECNAKALADVQSYLGHVDTITWIWADLPSKVAGYAYAGSNTIALDVDLECGWVPSVVMHEWMHIATYGTYGEYPAGKQGGELISELIADCGSETLGNRFGYQTYTNYANRAGGCTDNINVMVKHILNTY
jgi:hypothetical protein